MSKPVENFFESTDFQYDHRDHVTLTTAFRELKEDAERGYTYGLLTWAGSYFLFDRTFRWGRSSKTITSFVLGVTAYNMYTHKSRAYYDHLSQNFNRKTSLQLNSMMQ